ncbi:accessory Sec system translocase SecA2 [Paenibacillus silvae]|uniref:preprotein translocase subunit SecA n=1 Tax=Paenibacillus silvae TaxID=1325358 RepID=UPI0025A11B8A|nr:DEAD/DEAH box helicase [Paenibacillus silvae]MDM5281649.1 accessory Sec system translocase SecA2 [Paenibacillus silvae]
MHKYSAIKFIDKFKNRHNQLRLDNYRNKSELVYHQQQRLITWNNTQLHSESLRLKRKAQAGIPLDGLLIDAYALVCEATHRTLGIQPYDVQIMAAIALHEKFLVEQHTGEGKTLSAVMPAYLHALTGEGVHVLTFNDYLANRDANWMRPIYSMLGVTAASVQATMSISEKRDAYAADITYVTSKEAGFDYLRDTLALVESETVQRPFHYVIVDEADSLLLDEARVPLVIADEPDDFGSDVKHLTSIIRQLQKNEHYNFDEFKRNVYLNEAGSAKVESLLGCDNLYADTNSKLLISLNCALHAELLLIKDIDYIVQDCKIKLIDEYTGRIMKNRHFPEGLQSALYAKEGLPLKAGGKTLNTITLQHFLSLYPKICGMTATAQASAFEFENIYNLQVVQIPPYRANIRIDHPHRIYTHKEAKHKALVQEILSVHSTGRPILIGTSSVDESVILAKALSDAGVRLHVLNAANDQEEAEIIAKAGEINAVTVSTNMAGRGIDIRLGGGHPAQAEAVDKLGGLYVIGTNVNQNIRIDNQLRGRAGRQGDPGSSVFFVSLEDEFLLRFGADFKSHNRLQHEPLEDPVLREKLDYIQRRIMVQNFHIQQELNSYSDVIEIQRRILYEKRLKILNGSMPMSPSEQRVQLYYIDQLWAEHLAYASYIRESIHLIGLVKQNPIDEFHEQIIQAYEQIPSEIDRKSVDMLSKLKGSNDPVMWEKFGLKSPTSTWTYMINDHYQQDLLNRGSWTPIITIAYWLRKILRPVFG